MVYVAVDETKKLMIEELEKAGLICAPENEVVMLTEKGLACLANSWMVAQILTNFGGMKDE